MEDITKDIPILEPKEIIETITNMKTGEKYKDDAEWKAKAYQKLIYEETSEL